MGKNTGHKPELVYRITEIGSVLVKITEVECKLQHAQSKVTRGIFFFWVWDVMRVDTRLEDTAVVIHPANGPHRCPLEVVLSLINANTRNSDDVVHTLKARRVAALV